MTLEAGVLTDTIYRFPTDMRFFSTPDLLEIGDVPFIIDEEKPTRQQALNYYRRVVLRYRPDIRFGEKVVRVTPLPAGGFEIATEKKRYAAQNLVIATGYYQTPNLLHIAGESLPHVHHYYRDGHPYFLKKVVVIGGANSAVDAALDLYQHGAEVTLVCRGETVSPKVKPWVLPIFRAHVDKGHIQTFFQSRVLEIAEDSLKLQTADGTVKVLQADAVFVMTGYKPDHSLLQALGVPINPESGEPEHDPETMETTVPGLYIAGVIAAGYDANRIFIENGRFHGPKIVADIVEKINRRVPTTR